MTEIKLDRLERRIEFCPAFDCIVNPCKWGKDTCKPGEGGSHGRGGVDMTWFLIGKDLAIQFVVATGWELPETYPDLEKKGFLTTDRFSMYPMASYIGYHSRTPLYEGASPMNECQFFGECYYDGSSLNADKGLEILLREGSDAVWVWMKEYFVTRADQQREFGGTDATD